MSSPRRARAPAGRRRVTARLRGRRITRDSILFAVGILGVIYETIFVHADRPTLLILFATFAGSPFLLKADEANAAAPPPVPPTPAPPPTQTPTAPIPPTPGEP